MLQQTAADVHRREHSRAPVVLLSVILVVADCGSEEQAARSTPSTRLPAHVTTTGCSTELPELARDALCDLGTEERLVEVFPQEFPFPRDFDVTDIGGTPVRGGDSAESQIEELVRSNLTTDTEATPENGIRWRASDRISMRVPQLPDDVSNFYRSSLPAAGYEIIDSSVTLYRAPDDDEPSLDEIVFDDDGLPGLVRISAEGNSATLVTVYVPELFLVG